MIARKVSVRDDTIFLQLLQLEYPTAHRLNLLKTRLIGSTRKIETISFLAKLIFFAT
jgi:hypothetical protein